MLPVTSSQCLHISATDSNSISVPSTAFPVPEPPASRSVLVAASQEVNYFRNHFPSPSKTESKLYPQSGRAIRSWVDYTGKCSKAIAASVSWAWGRRRLHRDKIKYSNNNQNQISQLLFNDPIMSKGKNYPSFKYTEHHEPSYQGGYERHQGRRVNPELKAHGDSVMSQRHWMVHYGNTE